VTQGKKLHKKKKVDVAAGGEKDPSRYRPKKTLGEGKTTLSALV